MLFRRITITDTEIGLVFRDRRFTGVLTSGVHWIGPTGRVRVDVVSMRESTFTHAEADTIIRSGKLDKFAEVVNLGDYERAIVWFDGRVSAILRPGLHAVWRSIRKPAIVTFDARGLAFEHEHLRAIMALPGADHAIEQVTVPTNHRGVLIRDGAAVRALEPGLYAFWKGVARVEVRNVDSREVSLEVCGQDILTADRVTVRVTSLISYRVTDPVAAVARVADVGATLYREVQLALRAAVGARDLDALLADKEAVAAELASTVRTRSAEYGVTVNAVGVRDIILPGEIRELMNKVTEARKAAEAALITRREETASMRHQANTAKLLESNPMLVRLRELETIEKVVQKASLTFLCGESGIAERITKLL